MCWPIFHSKVNNQKGPELFNPLVLSFIDYDQVFDTVDRRALAKVPSLYSVPDKYIKVINAMHDNNFAVAKVGNKFSCCFRIESVVMEDSV